MYLCYNKLWILLRNKGMKKTDLSEVAGISSRTLAKLAKNETVSTETLVKICGALQCDVGDITEYASDNRPDTLYGMLRQAEKAESENEIYKVFSVSFHSLTYKVYLTKKKTNSATYVRCRTSGDIVLEQSIHVTGFLGRPARDTVAVIKPEHNKNEICIVVISGRPAEIMGLDEGIFNSSRHCRDKSGVFVMSEAAFKCFVPETVIGM